MNFLNETSDYISSGGSVMIPLVIVSTIMWILIIKRLIELKSLGMETISKANAGDLIKNNIFPDKKDMGINALILKKFIVKKTGRRELDEHILNEIILNLSKGLNNYLGLIKILSAAAPLLGLLGTVIGMVQTFDSISTYGTGNTKAMAGGISIALISTQTGLLVSIPGIYMNGFLFKKASGLKQRISAAGIYLKRHL